MNNTIKVLAISPILAILLLSAGCAGQQYNTVRVGEDRYLVTRADPNKLQGLAYTACQTEGYKDYTVVSEQKGSLSVRCEKEKKGWTETAGEVWNTVKEKVKDLSSSDEDKK